MTDLLQKPPSKKDTAVKFSEQREFLWREIESLGGTKEDMELVGLDDEDAESSDSEIELEQPEETSEDVCIFMLNTLVAIGTNIQFTSDLKSFMVELGFTK